VIRKNSDVKCRSSNERKTALRSVCHRDYRGRKEGKWGGRTRGKRRERRVKGDRGEVGGGGIRILEKKT